MLPLRARVDLGVMAIMGYSAFPNAPCRKDSIDSGQPITGEIIGYKSENECNSSTGV